LEGTDPFAFGALERTASLVKPQVADSVAAVREVVARARAQGLSIGLVPTMGAMHAGHASLMRAARLENGFVVASLFVNPTQFGPNEDYKRYPRTWEEDLRVCERERVDLVFAPEPGVMYPAGFRTYVEVAELQDVLCGASRPGHFRGVVTVVLKLFNIVQPDKAYFGQKDAQQVRIIRQMFVDLDIPVQLRVCPIVREADGLALSSRNKYLDAGQRRKARVLHHALEQARQQMDRGERDARVLRETMIARVNQTPGTVLDYAAVVDADTLQPLGRLRGEVLLALAVKFGTTRLIDNFLVRLPDQA
jgi:pantoate--beta-alanine ligase